MRSTFILGLLALLVFQGTAHASEEIELGISSLTAEVASDGTEQWGAYTNGEVRDANGKPAVRTSVVYNGKEYYTNEQGMFSVPTQGGTGNLLFKKPGYRKILLAPRSGVLAVTLETVEINSLYMQTGHLKRKTPVFTNAMKLIAETELNALTIDFKDDEGNVSKGLKPFIDELRANGVYTIARIVAFKDNVGPKKFPELALKAKTGGVWYGSHQTTFLDPYNPQAWEYLVGIAKSAVEQGFDEIQFDYVRFPSDGPVKNIQHSNLEFAGANKARQSDLRTAAIAGFLAKARKELGAMGAFVAADVFGITAFDSNDSGIGQRIEDVAPHLDYVCPMVYPSGYAKGTGGVKDPVDQPGDIVAQSVRRYRLRSDKVNKDLVIRPWLQAFRDYAYNHRDYGGQDIRDQINGSNREGGSGFLLWNAASKYSNAGLKSKGTKKVIP